MVTPAAPNPISMSDVNAELNSPPTTARALNDTAVRTLAGPAFATPGTTISMNDLRGKSRYINASGGSVTTNAGFRYHTFTGPGTFTINYLAPNPTDNTVIMYGLGGGGGGGLGGQSLDQVTNAGGGGGAGEGQTFTIPAHLHHLHL